MKHILKKTWNKISGYIQSSCLIKSFKQLNRRILWVMLFELLLVISIAIIFLFSSLYLKTSINNLGISDELMVKIKANMNNQTFARNFIGEELKQPLSQEKFQSLLIGLIYNILLSLISIALLISFFKSLEWSRITGKRLTLKFFSKYLALLLIWNIPWLILFFIIALGIKETLFKYLIPIEFMLFLYFSFILYPLFAKEEKVFKTIKTTFTLGTIKLYKLIVPFINIWILLQISYLVAIILLRIPLLSSLFFALCALFLISWIKFYMLEVIENAS